MVDDETQTTQETTQEAPQKEETGKEPASNSSTGKLSILEEVREERTRAEKARDELREENNRKERLIAEERLGGGTASGGVPQKKVELSDEEYAMKALSGEISDEKK